MCVETAKQKEIWIYRLNSYCVTKGITFAGDETRLSCMQKENFTLAIFFSVRWAIYAWTSEKITHTLNEANEKRFNSIRISGAGHSFTFMWMMLWFACVQTFVCTTKYAVVYGNRMLLTDNSMYVCKLHWLGGCACVCVCMFMWWDELIFLSFSISLYHSVHRHWREQIQTLLRANVRSRVSIFTKQPNPLKHDEYVRFRTANMNDSDFRSACFFHNTTDVIIAYLVI